jgi:hypothetical protein
MKEQKKLNQKNLRKKSMKGGKEKSEGSKNYFVELFPKPESVLKY